MQFTIRIDRSHILYTFIFFGSVEPPSFKNMQPPCMVFADLKNTVKGLNSETHITPATKVIYQLMGLQASYNS